MATKSTAQVTSIRSDGGEATTAPRMPFDAGRYPGTHAPYIALTGEYLDKVRAQEDMYVAAGFPAEGLADFIANKWFPAWEQRSLPLLRECVTDDAVYADPTTNGEDCPFTQVSMDWCNAIYKWMPDMMYYAQNDTPQALPYYDFLDGFVRVAWPWRMIGRGKFAPRSFDVVGVDRYNMVRDPERGWLISRIDTDGDMLGMLGSILPIPMHAPSQSTVQRMLRLVQKAAPSLRSPEVQPFVHPSR